MEKSDNKSRVKKPEYRATVSLSVGRKKFSGTIISAKMQETAVILCDRVKRHPKYKKTYRVSKKYKAHNAENRYQEGERVIIQASRPISKEKRWRIAGKVDK